MSSYNDIKNNMIGYLRLFNVLELESHHKIVFVTSSDARNYALRKLGIDMMLPIVPTLKFVTVLNKDCKCVDKSSVLKELRK